MKRHMTWSMLIVLLIVLGLVGVAAAQQPRSGGTLRVAWVVDGLTTSTSDGSGPMPQAAVIPL